MKKVLLTIVIFLIGFGYVNAQERTQIQEGVYLVLYGDKLIIEDDINSRSISVEVSQEIIDRQNAEVMYKVVCNKYVKTVARWALKGAIAEGVKWAAATYGISLSASAIALAADLGYEYMCDYLDSKRQY
jgi:hypothetical protein